ncbi:hypothetical protein FVEN_g6360 [Fusarium venenatum]|uniref:IDI-2 n=1 Tax=Fusarium venenatum TaxID=56646 RepID=A0A2L2TB63_9HYPO|nr:uncharacterized protein FVRRES_04612 [Fusarium venenatum]KAG8355641.1 hypothetical protein FVEN_g6360 [Fusarium venenatum]KAH6991768.1 hypothetical protein EDB82DRAFT_522900 [Fusarium venenatum]CEI60176.1 unnamed protein product [Fusarium venenatum]
MKAFNNFLLVLAYSAIGLSAATPASPEARAKAICGDLGILDITTLQDGVEPAELRLCADHPLGRKRNLDPKQGSSIAPGDKGLPKDVSPADSTGLLSKRICWDVAPYGCENRSYCWKVCGQNGEWCWTAHAGGSGAWRGCRTWGDCGTDDKDFGCGKNCKASGICGCSC